MTEKRAALWLPFFVLGLLAVGPAPAQERAVPDSMAQVQLSYAPAVKAAAPAVVNIYARKVVRTGSYPSLFQDEFFQRFFGNMLPNRPRERVENSLGSGVVVSADGVIVTNSHVIRDASEIVVALNDRREFEAELVVDDPRSDLAVLRVKADEPLPALEFADSDAAEVGDIILAIGNPFGVGQTVTSGIVSATARTHVGVSDYQFFIQTDAAINPGNSGGALIDLQGKLLGINTAIFSRSGGSHGIGFAIPANMVSSVVESAINEGKIVRPWLGVTIQDVTPDIAESLGLKRPRGVLVNDMHALSSFGEAGIRAGDLITTFDGFEVDDPGALLFRIATRQVGDVAKVGILRAGREQVVDVALIAAPETPARNMSTLAGENPFAGATVGNLNPAYAEELEIDPSVEGVIVDNVERRSYASRLGLSKGDIVLSVNDHEIETVADLKAVLAEDQRRWSIRINRGGQVRSVTVEL